MPIRKGSFGDLSCFVITSGSVPELNPSGNVLSVDANGDVILVPGETEKILALEARIKMLEEKITQITLAQAK